MIKYITLNVTKMMKHLSYLLLIVFFGSVSTAQNTFQPKPVSLNLKGVVYDFEKAIEFRLHEQGFALAYKKGRLRTYYRTTYQNFEIGYIKDNRETRQTKSLFSPNGEPIPTSFKFGKANEFFTLRYSLGEKRYLSEKTRRKGVATGFIYEGGVTAGLIKPYSIKVLRLENDNVTRRVETIVYSEDVEGDFLDYDNIYGGSSFWDGWSSITPTVGLHGKLAMHWSLGAFEKKVMAVEAGVMGDIFPQTIPLMVQREDITNSFYFFKLYASMQFGSRKRLGE